MKLKFDRLSRQAVATTARSVGLAFVSALALAAGAAKAAPNQHYVYFTSPPNIGYAVDVEIIKNDEILRAKYTIPMNRGGKTQVAYGPYEAVKFTARRSKYRYSNFWTFEDDNRTRTTARCITIQPWSVQYVADNTRGCKR